MQTVFKNFELRMKKISKEVEELSDNFTELSIKMHKYEALGNEFDENIKFHQQQIDILKEESFFSHQVATILREHIKKLKEKHQKLLINEIAEFKKKIKDLNE